MRITLPITCLTTYFISVLFCASAIAEYSLIDTDKGKFLLLDENDETLLQINNLAFKENWQWTGIKQVSVKEEVNFSHAEYEIDKGNITWNLDINTKDKNVFINSLLNTSIPVPLTYISLVLTPEKALHNGHILATDSAGKTFRLNIPLGLKSTDNIRQLDFVDAANKTKFTVDFETPVDIHHHSNSRIKLASGTINPEEKYHQKITLSAPQNIIFYNSKKNIPAKEKHTTWFPFISNNIETNNQVGMDDWLTKPTLFLMPNNDYIKNYGHPKIWGTNINYANAAPSKQDAIKRTTFFAKYGINSVRMHKLTNSGWEGLGSTNSAIEYDKEKLSRFDYWLHLLRNKGISYGFSPIWDLRIYEGDRDKLIAYDEIVSVNPKKPVTTSLVWFAKDIQDIHIKTITNLLMHKNPHSGLRYAQDPALAYVEIQNEENIFFYTFFSKVRKHPTYHKMLAEQFSDWLKDKYQTHSNLVLAWGASAIDAFTREGGFPNEQLSQRNITPVMNPWYYDNQATKGYKAKRLQDTTEFLLTKQREYYARATEAIRATGYPGLIVGGNWQAGSKGSHFLNLFSDAEVGIVDRHNYQGGGVGQPHHIVDSGFKLNNHTMLGNPGSGLLSTGMQQVSNHPFMISEWLVVAPTEWAAADTTLVAAYGFGLQGWDMSYHFSSDGNGFSSTLNPSKSKFSNLTPIGIGLFPILSRMVLRGDISEAEPIAIRRLNTTQALQNRYDFENTVEQKNDLKSFSGDPHHHALAAGKVLVEFTKEQGISSIKDWQKDYEQKNADGSKTITSSTGELRWTYTENTNKGWVEINSKGTQGIVGFTKDILYQFDNLSIQPHSPYSVILATAKSPEGTLANDDEAIIIAIARAHNTGMNIKGSLIAEIGTAPILLEPVKATLRFSRKGKIVVLDHDGIATGKTYPITDGQFDLDTERDKTIYYLVKFE
jgi:hypothetical protein